MRLGEALLLLLLLPESAARLVAALRLSTAASVHGRALLHYHAMWYVIAAAPAGCVDDDVLCSLKSQSRPGQCTVCLCCGTQVPAHCEPRALQTELGRQQQQQHHS
jgi:hypothetical protein